MIYYIKKNMKKICRVAYGLKKRDTLSSLCQKKEQQSENALVNCTLCRDCSHIFVSFQIVFVTD